MTDATAYPLAWPQGWKRTLPHKRQSGQFKGSADRAQRDLCAEIARLGGRLPVISSNVAIRRDGMPYADAARRKIDDPGVAVYFERNGKQQVFACDQYDAPWKNIRAITKTIEALRGIARWGASDMLERSLSAFEALPPPSYERPWWEVLGVNQRPPSRESVERAYRELARERHPDAGGSDAMMAELNAARAAALREAA